MKVRVKKLHPEAVIPKYAKPGDAGMDLVAIEAISNGKGVSYRTGLAIEIPDGYVGLIFPRSSIHKYDLSLANAVGVIDSGYRGEITFQFKTTEISRFATTYKAGERIGQLVIMPVPFVELVEAEELSSTERGTGGYGSSGA